MIDNKLRSQIVDYSRRMHARGWVANHDGNLTVRLGDGRFLGTPTAFSKAEVTADSLVTVDAGGAAVAGRFRPFSEIVLHLAVYKDRPDVQAVVHAHPPHATAMASAGRSLDQPFIAEAVVSLGPTVPLVPVSAPGPAAAMVLQPFIKLYDAVLISGNGVLAWGSDLEQAYLRLELVEHLARIYLLALPAGGVKPLPQALMPALLESRRKAGLGPEARGVAVPPPAAIPATRPAPSGSGDSDRLATLIREELAAALRRG